MTEPTNNHSEELFEFDFSLRSLPGEERTDVQKILDRDMQGYILADDYEPPQPRIVEVAMRDISPPWEVLRDHYEEIYREDYSEEDDAAFEQSLEENDSQLRLYPVRMSEQPASTTPRPVVIAWKAEKVVGIA